MKDRLLIGVLGHRNSGKSKTWNDLFGRTVRRGTQSRHLELRPNECVEVFLVSASFEERGEYAGDILKNQQAQIILCSLQYTDDVFDTLEYLQKEAFELYIQWLNPGYSDNDAYFDRLGLASHLLSKQSILAMRNGKVSAKVRVQEIRELIYGWAKYRNLVFPCDSTRATEAD